MALAASLTRAGVLRGAVAVAASGLVGAVPVTVMVTVAGLLVACPSLTTSWKVRVAGWPAR